MIRFFCLSLLDDPHKIIRWENDPFLKNFKKYTDELGMLKMFVLRLRIFFSHPCSDGFAYFITDCL